MIRLVVPLLVLTAVFWCVLYAVTHRTQRTGLRVVRQLLLSAGLALLALGIISLLAYLWSTYAAAS